MKTVVITGSARGLGFELAKEFRKNNYNVVLSDILEDKLLESKKILEKNNDGRGKVLSIVCDVTKEEDLQNLMKQTVKIFGGVDVWINNAGVNQMMVPIWEVESAAINKLIDIDLKSAIIGSIIAIKQMINQGYGQIYGIEGYGSNDAMMMGLSIYGTSKRGLTYFFKALAKEVDSMKLPIKVGVLSPGIIITDFLTHSIEGNEFELSENIKKIYNILGDYPDVIAKFLVDKIIVNTKNDVKFNYLTSRKAAFRFISSIFNKRDFFKINIHEMKLNDEPFKKIKSGKKKIEIRLNDEKRQKLKVHDLIEFTNVKTEEKLIVKVKNLYYYDSFSKLYKHFDKEILGYNKNDESSYKDMDLYYNKDEQSKYKALAIEIDLINR